MLASPNGSLFQSQTPESKTEQCPGFVLSLAGHRLAMLAPAMWLPASAKSLSEGGLNVHMCLPGFLFNMNNQMTKKTLILNVFLVGFFLVSAMSDIGFELLVIGSAMDNLTGFNHNHIVHMDTNAGLGVSW